MVTICEGCGGPVEQAGPGARRRRHPECGGARPRREKRPAVTGRAGRLAPVTQALTAALLAADLETRHGATVALAEAYAVALDAEAGDLAKLGPQLLAVLAALGMTKSTAAAVAGGGTGDVDGGSLARLRDRARARRPG